MCVRLCFCSSSFFSALASTLCFLEFARPIEPVAVIIVAVVFRNRFSLKCILSSCYTRYNSYFGSSLPTKRRTLCMRFNGL